MASASDSPCGMGQPNGFLASFIALHANCIASLPATDEDLADDDSSNGDEEEEEEGSGDGDGGGGSDVVHPAPAPRRHHDEKRQGVGSAAEV